MENHSQKELLSNYLGTSVRVPHSPTDKFKSVWSLALTRNTETGYFTGIFEGPSNDDINFLLDAINAGTHRHPLAILLYLDELLVLYYNGFRKKYSTELFRLEHEVGLTRGRSPAGAWSFSVEQFRSVTKDVNRLNTGLVYMERRLDFAARFAKFLLEQLSSEQQRCADAPGKLAKLDFENLAQKLRNAENFLGNQIHHVLCLQKRSGTVIAIVSDSKSHGLEDKTSNNICDRCILRSTKEKATRISRLLLL